MKGFKKMDAEELNITYKSFRNAYIYIFIFLFIWVINEGNDSMAFFLFISQGVVLSISQLYYKKKS